MSKKSIKEDIPVNNVGSGNISGANPEDPTNPPVRRKPKKLSVILKRKIPDA